jgi:competence protein ComEC
MTQRKKSGGSLLLLLLLLAVSAAGCRQQSPPASPTPTPAGGRLRVSALDVGQGDALLIVSPGGKSVLIDAGTPTSGDELVAALGSHGISALDLVVASHPHADHIGGMRRVFDRLAVRNFLDSGQTHTSATYERMLRALRDKRINFIEAQRGQTFDLDSGARLEVLNPGGGGNFITDVRVGGSVLNANSIVLRLSYGDFAMLFTGDAEAETEALMMKNGASLKSQVLKVGHHGSRYATSGKFIDTTGAQVAIISCGAENKYGHPAQETLDRLARKNVKIYRTDLNGEIEIVSDGKGYEVKPAREADFARIQQGRQATQGEYARGGEVK